MKTHILSANLEPAMLIGSVNGSYFFVAASIDISVDGHVATLQNGHGYYHNRIDHPSNQLEVYDGSSSPLIYKMWCADQTDLPFEDDFIDALNDTVDGRPYESRTAAQLDELYEALINVQITAQMLVKAAQDEAEDRMEADENSYVMFTEMEEDNDTGRKIAIAEAELKVFDTREEAAEFVEETQQTSIDRARVICRETARIKFPECF